MHADCYCCCAQSVWGASMYWDKQLSLRCSRRRGCNQMTWLKAFQSTLKWRKTMRKTWWKHDIYVCFTDHFDKQCLSKYTLVSLCFLLPLPFSSVEQKFEWQISHLLQVRNDLFAQFVFITLCPIWFSHDFFKFPTVTHTLVFKLKTHTICFNDAMELFKESLCFI